MSDEKRKVLEMLEAGKISQQDAERLLEALGETGETEPAEAEIEQAREQAEKAREEAEKAREQAEKAREEAEKARMQAEVDRVFLPAAEGTREELRGAVEEARQALRGAVGSTVPHLTLHPDLPEIPDIPEPPEPYVPEPPEPYVPEPGCSFPLPADGTPYDYPNLGDKVESLTIDWVSGPVEVRRGQGDALKVTEYANRPLKDGEMLELRVDDGEVTIRFCRERSFWNGFGVLKPTKHLVVELPCSLDHLEELAVKNVSGDVYVDGLEGEDFSISSVSGKVCPSNLRAEDLKLNSVSGGVQAASVAAEDLHITSTSGKVEVTGFSAEDAALTTVSGSVQAMGQSWSVSVKTTSGSAALRLADMPNEVKMNSMSGKLSLTLPDGGKGFTVKYNSRSGSFHSDFPLSGNLGGKSGSASYKDGEADVGMNTMSGSMELHRA